MTVSEPCTIGRYYIKNVNITKMQIDLPVEFAIMEPNWAGGKLMVPKDGASRRANQSRDFTLYCCHTHPGQMVRRHTNPLSRIRLKRN